MEANDFVAKLKVDESEKDCTDLDKVHQEYKHISSDLPAKDRGKFAVNVLCILCRNIEKVPSWRSQIDIKGLLTLSIDCVRETRTLDRTEQVRTLACIYHLHRFVVRQNSSVPYELVLKISYMAFEYETEKLKEYCKTYWNILADRLNFIDKLKSNKCSITKLFTKLTEDIKKVVLIYDCVQFCTNIVTLLIKKLHSLYSESYTVELNKFYGTLFEILPMNDVKQFSKLTVKESLILYTKFNECLYTIAENSSRLKFKDCPLTIVAKTLIEIFKHCTDIQKCVQKFYLNGFCMILMNKPNVTDIEQIMCSLFKSCEATEKMVCKKVMNATYPYMNQLLRLYIEYLISNAAKYKWTDVFTEQIQEKCLSFILFLMRKLKNCEQVLKCENCNIKSSLHDALRLSFIVKKIVTISLQYTMDVNTILPTFYDILQEQYTILKGLCTLGCKNYERCYKKLQTDVHNTAISLNKSQNYEFSMKLFNVYLINEIKHFKEENDMKNISRALYNKSICELDFKLYDKALRDAYLSLIFAQQEGLKTDKYMSLVMDIKAKALKAKSEDENNDDFQLTTVLDVCISTAEYCEYGNMKPFFCFLKFSTLLHHEFSMYVNLWPSVIPVAGVWKALHDLIKGKNIPWLKAQDDKLKQVLYNIVLETPTAVRSIHSDIYSEIVKELVQDFSENKPMTEGIQVVHATLLFLKTEYDLSEASQKYGWKPTEPTMDPDQFNNLRCIYHEYQAAKCSVQAIQIWTQLVRQMDKLPKSRQLQHALLIAQVFVPQLLQLSRFSEGLQLAHICCEIAQYIGDGKSFIRNAGTILQHSIRQSPQTDLLIEKACDFATDSEETLVFFCDAAIHYTKCGDVVTAAKLLRLVQARVLSSLEKNPDINLDLAIGRLLEAYSVSARMGGDCPSILSTVNSAQMHYLTVSNTATRWSSRHLFALSAKVGRCAAALVSCATQRALCAWRRARSAAAAALGGGGGAMQAHLCAAITNCYLMDDAQIKIDNRLKYILGLQPNENQPCPLASRPKSEQLFTPKQELETMLEHITFKKTQTSPSVPCWTVSGYKMVEFLSHGRNCECYACNIPSCLVLSLLVSGLEASMYFRANEFAIAKNYFDGTLRSFNLFERKLKDSFGILRMKFESYIVDAVEYKMDAELKRVEVQILIEAAYFELAQDNSKVSDEHLVRIHEILQETNDVDPYLRNEILNLMVASATLRKTTTIPVLTGLENELESLKLTPTKIKTLEPPTTPETKPEKPPAITKVVLKDEEIPNMKRRVIKLNLDENSDEKEQSAAKSRTSKRTFKIPVPITTKAVLEDATPIRTTRKSKPNIVVTQPSIDSSIFDFATPKPKDETKQDFFTPLDTPNQQFFTPMTSVKTYSKKTLMHGIVKNLEHEFATPKSVNKENPSINKTKTKFDLEATELNFTTNIKADSQKSILEFENMSSKQEAKVTKSTTKTKHKVETGSVKNLRDKRTLKRVTSPGKLEKEEKPLIRTRRLRQPVRLSIDDDEK